MSSLYTFLAEAASLATSHSIRYSKLLVPVMKLALLPHYRVNSISLLPYWLLLFSSILDSRLVALIPIVSLKYKSIFSYITISTYTNVDFIVLTIVSIVVSSSSVELTSITLSVQLTSRSCTSQAIYTCIAAIVFSSFRTVILYSFYCSIGIKSLLLSTPPSL